MILSKDKSQRAVKKNWFKEVHTKNVIYEIGREHIETLFS